MEKKAKLTLKQRIFVKELTKTLSPTEAAMIAYKCKDKKSAAAIANENLKKLGISFQDLMDKMGLNAEEDIKDLARLRKAKKPLSLGEDGEAISAPDNPVQLKALELTMKIKGHLKDKTEHSFDNGTSKLLVGALSKLNKK